MHEKVSLLLNVQIQITGLNFFSASQLVVVTEAWSGVLMAVSSFFALHL